MKHLTVLAIVVAFLGFSMVGANAGSRRVAPKITQTRFIQTEFLAHPKATAWLMQGRGLWRSHQGWVRPMQRFFRDPFQVGVLHSSGVKKASVDFLDVSFLSQKSFPIGGYEKWKLRTSDLHRQTPSPLLRVQSSNRLLESIVQSPTFIPVTKALTVNLDATFPAGPQVSPENYFAVDPGPEIIPFFSEIMGSLQLRF